jgi:DNA-binding CsgD family transcriptional regulator
VACVIDAIQPYIEYNFRGYIRRSKCELRKELSSTFSLSVREFDVVELMIKGETNVNISNIVRINIPTAKSYVIETFE